MTNPSDTQRRTDADRGELRSILEAFSDDGFEVEHVFKDSEWERTELVRRRTADGGDAPDLIVRKTIRLLDGQQSAYETLFAAQQRGSHMEHLPRIIECHRLGNDLVVLMENVPGETLEKLVARHGGSEDLARTVFPSVCDAVQELHSIEEGPVIHRDIKPSNVMVGEGGADEPCISLIDLGIARTFHEDAPVDTQRFGTPGYAPPEQFGYGQTNEASDVYALGMLLYYCLTGKEPAASLREGDEPFADALAAYRPVLVKATEFDPRARFTSADGLRDAFLAAARGEVLEYGRIETPGKQPAVSHDGRHFRLLGIIWDVVLAGAFVFSVVITCNAIRNAHGVAADVPFATQLITYLLISPVLSGALAYAIADRRPLRDAHPFFRKLSLLRETLVCVAIIVLSLLAIAIVWLIGTSL